MKLALPRVQATGYGSHDSTTITTTHTAMLISFCNSSLTEYITYKNSLVPLSCPMPNAICPRYNIANKLFFFFAFVWNELWKFIEINQKSTYSLRLSPQTQEWRVHTQKLNDIKLLPSLSVWSVIVIGLCSVYRCVCSWQMTKWGRSWRRHVSAFLLLGPRWHECACCVHLF